MHLPDSIHSPSLERFKVRSDGALSNLAYWKSLIAGGWTRRPLKGHFNQNPFVIHSMRKHGKFTTH